MRVSRVFWLLPAIWLAWAVVSAGVDVEHNSAVDFSGYATYAWHEGTPAKHRQAEERIREGVAQGLAAGGLLRTTDRPLTAQVMADRLVIDVRTLQPGDSAKIESSLTAALGVRDPCS